MMLRRPVKAMALRYHAFAMLLAPALLVACATDPAPRQVETYPQTQTQTRTLRTVSRAPAQTRTHQPQRSVRRVPAPAMPRSARPAGPSAQAAFAALPGWSSASLGPGLQAFRNSCAVFADRPDHAPLSVEAPWAGTVGEWRSVCASFQNVSNERQARALIEQLFVPIEAISPDGKSRFTGYFEPVYDVRRYPTGEFSEPIPALPPDLIANGSKTLQRLPGGRTRPYPPRAQITNTGVQPIAYAHPADVFFLQIQGSGRLRFADGSTVRAVYAAHNGHPFRSIANNLIRQGKIKRSQAGMTGIRNWMDRAGPDEARRAMNYNPRYIFFRAEVLGDPNAGPKGTHNVPLTALGSMAVDERIHPLGLPVFVSTQAPSLGGDWSGLLIAQDTGSAIKGAVRGDIYYGTGTEAGRRASTQNAPGRMWVLLPGQVAGRLRRNGIAGLGQTGFGP